MLLLRGKESEIKRTLLVLITCALGISIVSQVYSTTQASRTISNTGSIQTTPGINVYSDSSCTLPLISNSWGTLIPGASQNRVCYIKNVGNTPITLSFQTSNWYPTSPTSVSEYLALSWNYNNQPINVSSSIEVTLTLTVDPQITGISNFNFDLTIVGQ